MTVGHRFNAPLGEYLIDYVKRSLRCFGYFFVLVCVCLISIGLEIKLRYNESYVVSMVRYTEVRLYWILIGTTVVFSHETLSEMTKMSLGLKVIIGIVVNEWLCLHAAAIISDAGGGFLRLYETRNTYKRLMHKTKIQLSFGSFCLLSC